LADEYTGEAPKAGRIIAAASVSDIVKRRSTCRWFEPSIAR
jgi:hypothetical protein